MTGIFLSGGYVGLTVTVFIVAVVLILVGVSYVKAPPDTAFIITGLKKEPRVIIGRATLRIPFLERIDKISLSLMQVDIKTNSAVPTSEYINIFIDGVANIKVSSDPQSLRLAIENFLGRPKAEIGQVAQQVLEGNMREIVGQMKLSELVQNRDKFAKMVQDNASSDMNRMGLEIVNLTVQNFVDRNNIIEDLGMDNVTQIKKDAAIAKANGERDIAIASSKAKQDANEAAVIAETVIAEQNADLEIKRAHLKKQQDVEKAIADAAYDIQKEQERKTLETASINAEIAKREREVELRQKEVEVQERELESKIKKTAEAERYAAEQRANAELYKRQKQAEAEKYELLQKAEALKTQAEAEKFAEEQKAAGIRAVGQAEADAIEKKAEAMRKMGEASVLEMYLNVLPDIVKNAASPMSQIEKIVMFGDNNTSKLAKDIMKTSTQIIEGVKETTGIDLTDILAKFAKNESVVEVKPEE